MNITTKKRANAFNILTVLALAVLLVTAAALAAPRAVKAEEPTYPVMPDGFEQLYALSAPVDVDFDGDDILILEYDKADKSKNKLSIFRDGAYVSYDLSGYDATAAEFFMGRVLFLSGSQIFLFDETNGTAEETSVVVATAFSVYENVIMTNTSSGINVYTAEAVDGSLAFTKLRSLSLGNSPEALVLSDGVSGYYFMNGNVYLYRFDGAATSNDVVRYNTGDARYVTAHGDKIYYTIRNGVVCFDGQSLEEYRISSTPAEYNVQGLAFRGDRLFAAYKGKKAIKEIDLSATDPDAENFTLYSITAETDSPDRISEAAASVMARDDKLYILDGTTLKVASPATGEYTAYDLTTIVGPSSALSSVATDGRSVAFIETLVSGDTRVIIAELTDAGATAKRVFSDYKSVTHVTESEGEYYFINNSTNPKQQYTEIMRVDGEYENAESVLKELGVGWKLFIDVFGEKYLALVRDGSPLVYSDRRDVLFGTDAIATDLFADFDGNVYYSLGSDVLYRYDGESVSEYTFALWENAPEGATLKDAELLAQTDSVILLYNGFLLRAEGLDISTPQKISPPDDYYDIYSTDFSVVSLPEGSTLFRISPKVNEGSKYFDYIDYSTKTGDGKYILLREFSRYSLLADENGTYIVRSGAYGEPAAPAASEVNSELYITSDVSAYKLPVLDEFYASFRLLTNEKITVVSELTFNGERFSLVTKNGEEAPLILPAMREPDPAPGVLPPKLIWGPAAITPPPSL